MLCFCCSGVSEICDVNFGARSHIMGTTINVMSCPVFYLAGRRMVLKRRLNNIGRVVPCISVSLLRILVVITRNIECRAQSSLLNLPTDGRSGLHLQYWLYYGSMYRSSNIFESTPSHLTSLSYSFTLFSLLTNLSMDYLFPGHHRPQCRNVQIGTLPHQPLQDGRSHWLRWL